ncbi:hypothetical protein [Microbacterium algeriense]|nr:hypothetical protein [Microbacterium algeriense]
MTTSASATAGVSRQMTVSQLDRELRRCVEREAIESVQDYGEPSALGLEAMAHHDALRRVEGLQDAQAVADSWDLVREKYRRGFVFTFKPIAGEFVWALTGWAPRAVRLRIPLPRRRGPRKTVIVR